MEFVRLETDHVAGLQGLSGDPSPVTGYGVYMGMKAAAKARWGSDSLAGKTVAVQGCGKVATTLRWHLKPKAPSCSSPISTRSGSKQVVSETGATAVTPEEIYDQTADIFSPCALGAIINDDTLKRLKVEVIAGGANNQLAEDRHGDRWRQRGLPTRPTT